MGRKLINYRNAKRLKQTDNVGQHSCRDDFSKKLKINEIIIEIYWVWNKLKI